MAANDRRHHIRPRRNLVSLLRAELDVATPSQRDGKDSGGDGSGLAIGRYGHKNHGRFHNVRATRRGAED